MTGVAQLHVQLDTTAYDPDEAAELTRLLRAELLELDVDQVELASTDEVPEGARGLELLALGGLIVKLAKSSELLEAVVRTLTSWAERVGARSVRIEIGGDVLDIKGISAEDRRALIDSWIQRQAAQG